MPIPGRTGHRVRIAAAGATGAVVLTTAVALVLGYLNKARCAGPPFDFLGRSTGFSALKNSHVCYSDIQFLWLGRDIDLHVFPFIHGGILPTGELFGGSVEYPVLSGVLMWLGAIGAHTDAAFLLHSALILAPFGAVTAWLLGRLAGWRALWWSLSPTLVLYAFHNWDLPAVATVAAAAYVMCHRGPRLRWSPRTRGIVAAVLLAVGVCLKLYPGIFLVPVALAVLYGGPDADTAAARRRLDVRGALAVIAAAAAVVVAINLPFAALGFDGWRASFAFQSDRRADITTNSIWYWGLRPLIGDGSTYDAVVSFASPTLVVASFAAAVAVGVVAARRTGRYPWLPVSGAMLCGFMLLHKVDSPQYALWLLPMLVLVRVPWRLAAGYLAANSVLGVSVFRYYGALGGDGSSVDRWELVVELAVWSQAAALAALFVAFLAAAFRLRPRAGDETKTPPDPISQGRAAPGPAHRSTDPGEAHVHVASVRTDPVDAARRGPNPPSRRRPLSHDSHPPCSVADLPRQPQGAPPPAQAPVTPPGLSPREREVLRCWLLSASKEEASVKLHLAHGTIKSHLHRIRAKYEAVDREAGTKAALVVRALQDGIVRLDEF